MPGGPPLEYQPPRKLECLQGPSTRTIHSSRIISGGSRARLAEFGNRLFDNETDAFLSTVGVKGDKLFDGTWGYDGVFRYSTIRGYVEAQSNPRPVTIEILNQTRARSSDGAELRAGHLAYNPFGDFRVPIPSNTSRH